MKRPQTVYDVLAMLADYHDQRAQRYRQLAGASVDPKADILLEHLVDLESRSSLVVRGEMEQISPEHAAYPITGPQLSSDAVHAADCCCSDEPSFHDALYCARTSDQRLTELLDRMADCTAAASVVELARRLREFETTKERQIANFTRRD